MPPPVNRVKRRANRVSIHENHGNRIALTAVILGLLIAASADAQLPASAVAGQLVEVRINSASLKGNLLGDPAEQRVVVYLPPSYATSPAKRFPVVYLLHGYTGTVETWTTNGYQRMNLRVVMDDLTKRGTAKEMIVVVPNGSNRYLGSFYTNSAVNGNWEDYLYRDVVTYIDGTYRTIAKPASRGVAAFDGRLRRDIAGYAASGCFRSSLCVESMLSRSGWRSQRR